MGQLEGTPQSTEYNTHAGVERHIFECSIHVGVTEAMAS